MEDSQIVALYWARQEQAIQETAEQYGRYCYAIAYGILSNREDAEESVNDTYMGAWNSMPPHRPAVLATFLGKLTRRISLNRWRYRNAQKRGGGEPALALEELLECIPAGERLDETLEAEALAALLNKFLDGLPETERHVFVRRYWHLAPVAEICQQFGFSKSKVETMLYRTRGKLRLRLEKEGFFQ